MLVFAYGSLLSPVSASATIGRELSLDDMTEYLLLGWRRVWRAHLPLVGENLHGDVDGVFLDVGEAPGEFVNGYAFAVDDVEMSRLRAREVVYDLVDCTDLVFPAPEESMGVFVTRPEHRVPRPGALALAPTNYVRLVDEASSADEGFRRRFAASYVSPTQPQFTGTYRLAEV